jgi:hypothetical protein
MEGVSSWGVALMGAEVGLLVGSASGTADGLVGATGALVGTRGGLPVGQNHSNQSRIHRPWPMA